MNRFLFLALITAALSYGQIRSFKGGSTNFNIENALTPFGSSVEGDAAGTSSNFAGNASLFNNPTGLFMRNGMYLDLDIALPGLSTTLGTDGLLKDPVREGVKGAFEDVDEKNITYPDVRFSVSEPMDIRGLGFFRADTIQGHKFHYGFGYSQTQNLDISGDLQGLAVEIASATDEEDAASDSLFALIRGMFSLDFNWNLKEYATAVAYQAPHIPVIFGLGLKYHSFNYNLSTFFRGDGYLARNGLTYGFYTPRINYPDSLYANYYGEGSGGAPGVQIGVTWEANEWLNTGVYFDWSGTIDVDGGLEGFGYNLFGLDPSSGDLDMSKMNLTKLTLTQRHEYEIRNMTLSLPSKVGLNVSGKWKQEQVKTNLSYAYYYKDMEWYWDYTHRKTMLDSAKEIIQTQPNEDSENFESSDSLFVTNSRYGFAFQDAQILNLGFDIYGWHWNLGAMFWSRTGVFHKNKITEWDLPNVMPLFSFGWKSYLGNHLELDLSLIALPESFLKTSVRYQF